MVGDTGMLKGIFAETQTSILFLTVVEKHILLSMAGAIFYFDGDSGGGRYKATFDSAGFSVSSTSAER